MKIYALIYEEDTDSGCGNSVKLFSSREEARNEMRKDWAETVKDWKYDQHEHKDEDECECREDEAVIREREDVEHWRIEEHDLDVSVAVEVKGDMVQNVYANANVIVDVYDTDIPDFFDEQEETEAEAEAMAVTQELQKCIDRPGWRCVY